MVIFTPTAAVLRCNKSCYWLVAITWLERSCHIRGVKCELSFCPTVQAINKCLFQPRSLACSHYRSYQRRLGTRHSRPRIC